MGRKAVRRQRSDVTIDEDEVLELSRELIRIPSVYTKELDVARHVAARLRDWGFSPRTIPVDGHGPDVVAEFGRKDAPAIVFNGHMDTVDVMQGWKHDPFDAKVERGMLYGLGSLDMKCGLAAMMVAFKALARSGAVKNHSVKFQAAVGEEDTGAGAIALIEKGEFRRAKAVIVGEGFGGLDAITVGRRGGTYYDIDVVGKSAHGATPEQGVNAVVDAARLACALDDMEMRSVKGMLDDSFAPLKEAQTVLKMDGGGVSLSVPDRCYLKIVRCTVPGGKVDVKDDLEAVVRRLALRSKVDIRLRVGPADPLPPHLTDPSSGLVRAAKAAVEACTGRTPTLVCGVSEADDNIIAQRTGVPVICVGPGESGARARYHQPEEAVRVSQLGPAARIYVDTVLRLDGAAHQEGKKKQAKGAGPSV